MLNFILATSKSSKTEYLSEKVVSLLSGNNKVLILVPEQYTLIWERKVLDKKPKNLVNLEILNFNRLYNYATKYSMHNEKRFIDSTAKKILMYRAINQVKDNLLLYTKNVSMSFLSKLIEILDEFVDYNVSLDSLEEKVSQIDNAITKEKINDILLIVNAYFALLENSGFSSSSEQQEIANIIKETDFLKDTVVVLDGFDTFSPLEYNVLYNVIKKSKDTIISLCTNTTVDKDFGYGIFSIVKSTYARLYNEADKNGINSNITVLDDVKYSNKELLYLEENIFRSNKVFLETANNISIYGAKDVFDEADYIAQEISKLIYEKKADYKDIVVVGRKTSDYLGILDYMLIKYNIPFFYDRRSEILSKPLIIYITTLLNIATYNLDSVKLITILKTGFSALSDDEIFILENYLNKWNIKPRELKNDETFSKSPKGFGANDSDEIIAELAVLNDLKVRATSDIIAFCENIKNKNAKEISIQLYEFLVQQNIPKKIAELSNIYIEKSELALAQENKQILNTVIEVLDQFSVAFEEKIITIKMYKELLEYVLSDVSIGKIPTSLNEVSIGDINRIRVDLPKYVFVLGMCDGVFPSITQDDKILTNRERDNLELLGINISREYEEQVFTERFYGYLAMSMPKDKLFLSYYKTAPDGKETNISYFLKTVEKLFPNCINIDFSTRILEDKLYREAPALEILACKYEHKNENYTVNILDEYFRSKIGSNYLESIIVNPNFTKNEKISDKNRLSKLYSKDINISASKSDVFFKCKFNYFCEYILRLKEKNKISFDSLQVGSFIHYVLEKAFIKANEKSGGIKNQSDEEIIKISKDICGEYLVEYMHVEKTNKRFLYIYKRLCATVVKLLLNIRNEFMQSEFKSTAVELKIGDNGISPIKIELQNGGSISLVGKVDRVDILEKNNEKYIRIVDYKTGSKEFSFSDINNGLNLQLFIYLFSILQNGGSYLGDNLKPAAALYFPAKQKILSVARNTEIKKIQEEREKSFKMNGILLKNDDVIAAMEADLEGRFIPAKASSKGISSSSLVTLEQFSVLKNHIESLLLEMGNSILSGDVKINPYKDNKNQVNSCQYCKFKSVCGMEPGKGNPRKYNKISKEEFLNK